jgi:hypothetical protein
MDVLDAKARRLAPLSTPTNLTIAASKDIPPYVWIPPKPEHGHRRV